MTFITSGIFNGTTFLMSDCVATPTVKEQTKETYRYRNKINRLISPTNEAYCCHTGAAEYDNAIELFDKKYFEKHQNFDFKNIEHITEIVAIFKLLKSHYESEDTKIEYFARLYFIDASQICFYDIYDDCKISEIKTLKEGEYIEASSAHAFPTKLGNRLQSSSDIIDFCKKNITNYINLYNKYGVLGLKDRFSYVIFDKGKADFNNSITSNEELILSVTAGDYGKLT